jgi:hypothetical protein
MLNSSKSLRVGEMESKGTVVGKGRRGKSGMWLD